MKKNGYSLFIFFYISLLTLLNLYIGLKVFIDPGYFPTSNWDLPWLGLFAVAFFSAGLLFLLVKNKALVIIPLSALAGAIIPPVMTIGAGPAFLVLILILLIALGAGEFLLKALLGRELPDGLERTTLSILLGLGAIMVLVSIQGAMHAFEPVVTWVGLTLLAGLFVIPRIKHWYTLAKTALEQLVFSIKNDKNTGWGFIATILVILFLPSLALALAPAIRYDELTYHLAGPAYYLREGGIVIYPPGGMNAWLHYAEMLFTLGLGTAGQPLPRLFHLLMGALSAIVLYRLGFRVANRRVAAVSVILFLAVPVICSETATAYIDLFVTAYVLAASLAVLAWWLEGKSRWLLVAGILGGFGLGIKITASPVLIALVVVCLIGALVRLPRMKNLLWLGAMIGLFLLIALPWFVRDTIWTGDPFDPYGARFIQKFSTTEIPFPESQVDMSAKLTEVLRYPLDLVLYSSKYYLEAPGGIASALPLLAIPLFLFIPRITRQSKILGTVILAVSALTVMVTFIIHYPLIRYVLPIFAYLALGAALNFEGVVTWISNLKYKWVWPIFLFTSLLYLFSTRIPLIMRAYDILPDRFPISYLLGLESREEFLSENLSVYDAFQFIDSQAGGPQRVLSIGNEFRLYTTARIDGVNDIPEASLLLSSARAPADLASALDQAGYDFILINHPVANNRMDIYTDPYPILWKSDFLNLYCELVFVDKGVYVYRFDPRGVHLPASDNLLANSGFEEPAVGNDLPAWEEFGNIGTSSSSQLGAYSLLVNGPYSAEGAGYAYQSVPVESQSLYTLRYYVRSDQQAVFLMQITWLDKAGNVIGRSEERIKTTPEWQWYFLSVHAPDGATYAQVYSSLVDANSALVDEVCFAKGQRCVVE